MKANLDWLSDPEVFGVHKEKPHSDHKYYRNWEEKEQGKSSFFQCLNGTWKFSYAENPSMRKRDFYKNDFDCSDFDEIQVPGHIQLQGYDKCQYINTMYPWDGQEFLRPPHISSDYNPVGSYVTYFTPEIKTDSGKLYLSFQGVETSFYVWVNGTFVGYGEDTFTPTEFDVTGLVGSGKNKLAVEVYKRSSASWVEDQDFWRFSGIFRDVYLRSVPDCHVRDLFVKAGLENDYKDGVLNLELELLGEMKGKLIWRLKDQCGKQILTQEQDLQKDMSLYGEIPSVHAWSAELPYLYELEAQVVDAKGRIQEVISQKVGFRNFEMLNHRMCINGKRILFKGVNRHEFSAERGRSITEEDMLWDIRFMKRNNINAVRTCHYPNMSRWYELCDEYGIYLIDEMNLESHGSWQKMGACDPSWNVPGSLPEWKECMLDRASSMLERDKNHPSVLIWSCGNESYVGENIAEVSRFFHARDNSRLVHYEGVFWNRAYENVSDMESRMYAKPEEVTAYLESKPKKPYISCEYMHAMGNSLGGMKLYTDLEDQYDGYQGGFIWDFIDQALYKRDETGREVLAYGGDFDDRATDYCFCTNGIVYADRTESEKVPEVRQLYSNIRINVEDDAVIIENRNLFLSTEGYKFLFFIEKDGERIAERRAAIQVQPGEKITISFGLELPETPGVYTRNVSVQLGETTDWANKGYEIVFGQEVIERKEAALMEEAKAFRIVHGDVNIGVRGEGFSALFGRDTGGICSLVYKGEEYITRTPMVSFWRALTDNDKGWRAEFERAPWLAASRGAKHLAEEFQITEESNRVKLTFTYLAPTQPSFKYQVEYCMYASGKLFLKITYPGVKGLPQLPLFGMDLKLKKKYDRFTCFGYGPQENYQDRREGARLCKFKSSAAENMPGYLIPQECGNRTGVRYLEVYDKKGQGLHIQAESQPFECSVLPYSAYELDHAMHREELAGASYTWVRIMAKQMGVGGDDSWGAEVHPQFCISAEEKLELTFSISPIGEKL